MSPPTDVDIYPHTTMRIALALVAASFAAACADTGALLTDPTPNAARLTAGGPSADRAATFVGGVFTQTNDASANAVLAFDRASDGTLTPAGTFPTGGRGIGGTIDPLVSQFSVVLSPDHHYLYVANAGSDQISVFRVGRSPRLTLVQTIASGGTRPVSLAISHATLYALNQASNTLTGFAIQHGQLTPVPSWTRALSAGASGGAEVHFSHNEKLVAVTARASNTIDTYLVQADRSLSAAIANTSSGPAPFGFDFTNEGQLVAVEAASGTASSYDVTDGVLRVRTASSSTLQSTPCWLVITPDGRHAYTANAGSGSLTGFAIGHEARLTLLDPTGVSASFGATSAPLDLGITGDGRFLYVLQAGAGSVGALAIAPSGALQPLGNVPAQSPGSGQQGIAVY